MQTRLIKQLNNNLHIAENNLKTFKKILDRLNYQKNKYKCSKFDKFGINFLINNYTIDSLQLEKQIFELKTQIYILQNPDDDMETERCKVGCNILSAKKHIKKLKP